MSFPLPTPFSASRIHNRSSIGMIYGLTSLQILHRCEKMSHERADEVTRVVLDEFSKLPKKRKPPIRGNGVPEWVPLSGIVAKGTDPTSPFQCLSLATGMKCLPANKMSQANGVILHDWHAEILALRAFNHFVLEECRAVALGKRPSEYIRPRSDKELEEAEAAEVQGLGWNRQPYAWRDDVSLYMYCSESPCGDASMELIMAAQEDASPWDFWDPPVSDSATTTPPSLSSEDSMTRTTTTEIPNLPGRAYFSQLGVVRRKPARGDAPRTLSKSCSDKIALKQCTSLLSSLTSLLVSPKNVYLRNVILPESRFSSEGCARAFSATPGIGRMSPLLTSDSWPGGYGFHPFTVETTETEFDYSKRTVTARAEAAGISTTGDNIASSPLAVTWSRNGLEESTINGVLQGRKQLDRRGGSKLCRLRMWGLALEVSALVGAGGALAVQKLLDSGTYAEVKNGDLLTPRRLVKSRAREEALRGWVQNVGDDTFGSAVAKPKSKIPRIPTL
ncbi:hypothetical protein ACKVV1_010931 [Pyricularia oryzae]